MLVSNENVVNIGKLSFLHVMCIICDSSLLVAITIARGVTPVASVLKIGQNLDRKFFILALHIFCDCIFYR